MTALRSSMGETHLRRGEVLFHEGDTGDRLYVVLEGKVKLGRTSSDGRENLLAIMGPGQMFGEL
ncbi:MAG TPA: cyclic nucleotide-binding domain-containing protein, partial [Nocardioides sp.]|nr:cyclic nucleotide-binding domain-containing protein [Nocardioides sp.]